jgi:molecular chaperone DnaK (HSP70)
MPEELIACVDFGTTYSSVTCYVDRQGPCIDKNDQAFLVIHQNDLIQISGYTHGHRNGKRALEEVPSQLFFGKDGSIYYGYTISHMRLLGDLPPGICLTRFKLLLDNRSWVSKERQDLETAIKDLGLSVEDVIVKYLTFLLEHTKSHLIQRHSYKQGVRVRLVATVPAIWNSTACMVMHRATQRAAIGADFGQDGDVFLVAEPDAAATFFCQVKIHRMLEVRTKVHI